MSDRVEWDLEYGVVSSGDLISRLAHQAWGEEYPLELRPYGFTTRAVLRLLHERLAVRPGDTLADLACGEGGPGGWLARAGQARLVAVDWSIEGLRAARRLAQRLDQRPDQDSAAPVRYVVATLTGLGLADASVDAAICLDALMYCDDRPAACREMARVLRPGGRFAITAQEAADPRRARPDLPRYRSLAEAAGLRVGQERELAGWRAGVRRNFELWQAHADDLCAELGDRVATTLLAEATEVLATLAGRRQVLLTGVRPDELFIKSR